MVFKRKSVFAYVAAGAAALGLGGCATPGSDLPAQTLYWRAQAKETIDRYKANKARSFNILYANTQTTVPALYNSEPVPDVRRRFGDDDEAGQTLAEIIERAISIQAEMYDFDSVMRSEEHTSDSSHTDISRMPSSA